MEEMQMLLLKYSGLVFFQDAAVNVLRNGAPLSGVICQINTTILCKISIPCTVQCLPPLV